MPKKTSLALLALLLSCDNQKPPLAERLEIPKIEITDFEPVKAPEKLEQKVKEPAGEQCTINLSDHFIPELLSLSRDAEQYFLTEGILQNPFQRERFGIFSGFEHHKKPFEHYAKAIERRGNEKQPKIENKFVPYTTEKTPQRASLLEKRIEQIKNEQNQEKYEKELSKIQREYDGLQKQINTIKNVQKILHWEGFYHGEINGIYNDLTASAVMKYQRFHQQYLHYNWKIEGKINFFTRELLNKDLEGYAFGGVRRVLEERVFHAQCSGRYPYVIEKKELEKAVDSAAQQLNLNTIGGVQEFLSKEHQEATVYLEIPRRYQQDSMKLEIEVEKWDSGKWEKVRTRTNLRLYAIEEGNRVELFQTKAVVGGWVKNKKKGTKKQYQTPEREFYLKHATIMPHWNPPKWAAEEEEVKDEEKLPGPFNAFGMINTPLYYDHKPQKDPFRGWQDGDNGYRIHLTPWPSSVEYGGASHGCIRIHPNMSRFFYFLVGYTPHRIVLEKDEKGKETLKFTPLRGSYIPFEPEHYIKVRTCKEKCD